MACSCPLFSFLRRFDLLSCLNISLITLRLAEIGASLGLSTYRAKAGGKQSSKDATGKYAKSAGSQIRRQNEVRKFEMSKTNLQQTGRSWHSLAAEALLQCTKIPIHRFYHWY